MASIVSRTVEVCVFKKEGERVQYLLLKRSDDEPLYPGMWQLVTGSIKEGEHAVKAAVREFQEETGLELLRFWVVPFVNSFYVAENDTVHASPLFAVEIEADREPRLSHEHQEFKWCSYEAAVAMLVWPGQRFGLQIVHEYIVGGQEASRLLSLQV
jgi:dihydroneopterin triphosphate diphosphatase